MPISHPYDFFGEMSIQIFCPFFNRVVCFVFFGGEVVVAVIVVVVFAVEL